MNKQRNFTIDNIRAIATIAMILIHTSYYFISDPIAWFVWNWSQFAVPAFVFCSGYVFFLKEKTWTLPAFLQFERKRFIRLLVPYYIFALFFLVVLVLIHTKITANYILQSIFLNGGIDIDWLVLLMIELAIVFPLLSFLKQKNNKILWMYTIVAILFCAIPLFHFSFLNFNYKLVMWIGWSLTGLSSILFLKETNRKIIKIFVSSLVIFLLVYFLAVATKHDTSFINNKYPPDLLLITYGIGMISALYWLSQKGLFKRVEKYFFFISSHSYSIYFIHYCLLIFLASFLGKLHLAWYSFFAIIFVSTIFIQYSYNFLQRHLFNHTS